MDKHPAIAKAIVHVGSQPKLAALAGVSQQHISKLLNRQRKISAEVALGIEMAAGDVVPRWELRPDLWSPPKLAV